MVEVFSVLLDWHKPELKISTDWATVWVFVAVVLTLLRFESHKARPIGASPAAKLKSYKVKLDLPGAQIEGYWEVDDNQRRAAWELYVELVTRTAVIDLDDNDGSLREALSSLHTLFETSRKILKEYGPGVAIPKGKGQYSFGSITLAVLNKVVRPVLAKWHPELRAYEELKDPEVPAIEHERNWPRSQELRDVLRKVRQDLRGYARLLGEVAEVPPIID